MVTERVQESSGDPATDLHAAADALHNAAVDVQIAEQRAETAEAIAEAVTEQAQQEIDAAAAHAAAIEKAAMETVLGARITALENEVRQWQSNALEQLQTSLVAMMEPVVAELRMIVEAELLETEDPETKEQSSTLPNSEPETPAELAEQKEPEKSQENPAPQKPQKLVRWV